MNQAMSGLGLLVLIGSLYLLSSNRKAIPWKLVGWGIGLQLIFAVLILGIPHWGVPGILHGVFGLVTDVFNALLAYTEKGSEFIFGALIKPELPHGFIFAIKVLPTIIFFSSLMAVLYYLGMMQWIVGGMARLVQNFLGTSGAETLSTTANIFVGQTEAPLLVKPYVEKMTPSELMAVMVGGMATVAGGVMAAYVMILRDRMPDIAGHLLSASVMSAPAALVAAKMLLPETATPLTKGKIKIKPEIQDANVIEAAARGAGEGMSLALNVAAMLLAFIALIALINGILGTLGSSIGFASWGESWVPETLRQVNQEAQLSLELILSWLFAPLAFLMGVPWSEAPVAGVLFGQKLVLNEFVAYMELGKVAASLSDRTVIICSYALCGFANFSSIAIQIGGIGSMAPSRRSDLARLGFRAMIGGSIAAFLTATIAGILY